MMNRAIVPDTVDDPTFCGIDNNAPRCCRIHNLAPRRCVAFEGFDTGRKFYKCPLDCVSLSYLMQLE